jgi:hypothetical protein
MNGHRPFSLAVGTGLRTPYRTSALADQWVSSMRAWTTAGHNCPESDAAFMNRETQAPPPATNATNRVEE